MAKELAELNVQEDIRVTTRTRMNASNVMLHVLLVRWTLDHQLAIEAVSDVLNVPMTILSGLLQPLIAIKLVHQANLVRAITFVHRANNLAPNAKAIVEIVPPVDRKATSLLSLEISACQSALLVSKMSEASVNTSARIATAKSAIWTMFARSVNLVFIYTKATV